MSLAVLGFLAIAGKRVSLVAALVLVPLLTSLAAGFGWTASAFMVTGIRPLAPVITMFVFAALSMSTMLCASVAFRTSPL